MNTLEIIQKDERGQDEKFFHSSKTIAITSFIFN